MQSNITVLDDSKFYDGDISRNGAKLAKLSTFNNVKSKSSVLMESVRVKNEVKSDVPNDIPSAKTEEVANTDGNIEQSQEQANVQVNNESNNEVVSEKKNETLPLTPKEVLENKKDILGITAYLSIDADIEPILSIQNVSRRLKTNPVVPGNINRERNVNGIEHEKNIETEVNSGTVETNDLSVNNNTFDFGNLPGVSEVKQDEKVSSNSKIDEWLNKENGNLSSSDDALVEVNELRAVRDSTADSLATQKEILANLKKRIEQNKALVEERKEEIRQENMALTQELNDVLAEINKLSDIEAEQNAFLGIENTNVKTM